MTKKSSKRSLTIADVAKEAGVSLSTVSRVMNGNAKVDPGLAAKVHEAARSLNYTASPLARSLVLGKTHTVAVVVPDLENPTFQGILRGVTRAAARDGYRVLIADSSEDVGEEGILALETRRRCDAILLCAPRMPERQLLDLLPEIEPVVLINRDTPGSDAPVVAADYRAGIFELLRHFASLGHRDLVYVAGAAGSASNALRLVGIEEFQRIEPEVRVRTLDGGVGFQDGYDAVDAVLASGATGVLAFNDLVAMGLLSGLHQRGMDIPGDLSIAGFDGIPFSEYTTPPLTTAVVPSALVGEEAWLRLHSLLTADEPAFDLNVRPKLAVRGSTSAPRE